MSNLIHTDNNANVIDLETVDPMLALIGAEVDFGSELAPVPVRHTTHANPLTTARVLATYDDTDGDFGVGVDAMPVFRATSLA